jgi:hypothetical protein
MGPYRDTACYRNRAGLGKEVVNQKICLPDLENQDEIEESLFKENH